MITRCLPLLCACSLLTLARAEDPSAAAPTAPAPKPPSTSVNVGFSMTDGNSETVKANGSVVTEAEKAALGSLRASLEANYGESTVDGTSQTDVENGKAALNLRRTLTPRTFLYGDFSAFYDNVAEVDYRLAAGPGAGAYLLKNEGGAFSLELGPTYIWEEVAGEYDDYPALRIGQRFDLRLSATAKAWESAEYLPEFADFGRYLVNAETGLEAAVNTRVSLRLVLQNTYNSEAAADVAANDLSLIGGIGIKL